MLQLMGFHFRVTKQAAILSAFLSLFSHFIDRLHKEADMIQKIIENFWLLACQQRLYLLLVDAEIIFIVDLNRSYFTIM